VSARVVTLTLSPALDISTATDNVAPTHKLRCERAAEQPGGGGVNVARVAVRLGADAIAVLPLGGPTGTRISQLLTDENVPTSTIAASADSRQSFSVTEHTTGDQYRFVLAAPELTGDELSAVIAATAAAARQASCVVVSGQIPPGVDPSVFTQIVNTVAPVPVIIDTSGPALVSALRSGAALVKPSARELSSIVERDLGTEVDVCEAARSVHADGNVETLIVSIGAGGAFSVGPNGVTHRFRAPSVRVRSAIGAGDSMVAGIAVAMSRGFDVQAAIPLGIAAGAATVLTDGTELCHVADVSRLAPLVAVETLD
jgi:6-phosphofructokinase 2